MTSPQAAAANTASATIPAPEVHDTTNPNLNHLTAVGNTEDGLQNQQNENGTLTADQNTSEDLQNQQNGNGMQRTNFNTSEAQPLTNLDHEDLLPPQDLAFTSAYPLESVAAYYDPLNPMNPMPSSLDLLAGLAGNSALGPVSNDMFARMPMGMPLQPAPEFLNFNADYAIPAEKDEEDTEHEVTGFAKLDFPDGSVYITTYTITLGRDQYAFLEAKRRERQEARLARQLSLGDPQTPQRIRQNGSYYRPPRSVMSDAGGILRLGDDEEEELRTKKRSKTSRSGSVISGHVTGNQGGARYQDPRFEAFSRMNGQAEFAEDANTYRPRRTEKPLLMIHPGALAEFKYHKKISREHLKISWHSRNRLWEGWVLGRNGVFLDDVFYPKGAVMTLTSGCVMQISNLDITFSIPGVPHGETGAAFVDDEDDDYPTTYSEGGKAMSFDFEDRPREGATNSDDDEQSEDEPFRTIEEDDRDQILDEYEHENEDEGSVEAKEEVIEEESDGEDESPSTDGRNDQSGQDEQQFSMPPEPIQMHTQEMQPPPKKRGPGRPPKDGIMSKREKQEAKKAAMAQAEGLSAKKNVPDAPAVPTKNKVGRPRKHPIPEPTEEVRPKRKYTKRRPKEPKEGEVKQEGEGGEAEQATSAKKEKPEREERSPSPVWDWDNLTQEQLAKPSANYVQLIYDVLVNSDKGPTLSLPQIYRRMQRKYPYFCHANTTVGWQSSVRHNLSQHEAFEKVEREGKGYRWGLKEGATIEKEKKRSNPPPPQQHPGHMGHQPIYSHPYQMIPGHPYPPPPPHMRGPPPGWYPPPQPGQYPPGQYPYMGLPPHMPHYPGSHLPPGIPASMPPQLAAPNAPGSYSSPYAPKPAAASEGSSNEQRPPLAESTMNHTQPHGHPSQQPPPQTEQLQAPPPPQNSFQPQISQAYQSPLPAQSVPVPVPELNQPPRPKPNEATLKTVAAFKSTMTGSQTSQPNLPAIVDSAISQVLCYTNQSVLAEVHQGREKQIMGALRELLGKIPGTNLAELQAPTAAPPSNQNGTQAGAPSQSHQLQSTTPAGPDKIVRPQFNGSHSRPNIPIPRPGFMSGNMPRNNSGSPAMTPARTMPPSASPAPSMGGMNGASASNVPVGESVNINGLGQLAGQKRNLDEAALGESEMGDSKRLSTTGPPQMNN